MYDPCLVKRRAVHPTVAAACRETSPGAGPDSALGLLPGSLWRATAGGMSTWQALNVARRAWSSLSYLSSVVVAFNCCCVVLALHVISLTKTDLHEPRTTPICMLPCMFLPSPLLLSSSSLIAEAVACSAAAMAIAGALRSRPISCSKLSTTCRLMAGLRSTLMSWLFLRCVDLPLRVGDCSQ